MEQNPLKSFILELASCLKGPLYVPHSEGYASEIAAYNRAVEHTPDVVVGATSERDIIESVRLARQYGYSVSVQNTGHGALEPITSGVLISTRRLDQVSIDVGTSTATIAAGVKWGKVFEAAAIHGLTPISGSSMDVGVVGDILGGGVGPLARSHGFSSDYLTGIKVVTGSGKVVEASATEHPDLFWALRGGKINLGIVTEVRVRLVKLNRLYAGSLTFEEKDIEAALRAWADWTKQADSCTTTSVAIVRFPALPAIPEMFRGRRLLMLRFAFPGSVDEGAHLAAPLRSCAPVYLDCLGELPPIEMGRIHNDPSHPMPFWAGGLLLNSIDQDAVSAVLDEMGAGRDSPFSALEIRHIGGATHQDVNEGSSVGGRSARFVFSLVGKGPKQSEKAFSTQADQLFNTLGPWICEEGNINLMGKTVRGKHFTHMWPPETLKRLKEVRERYTQVN
jgi:hypothetical protein